MKAITASALACQALRLSVLGTPREHDPTTCTFCGVAIAKGDLEMPFDPAKSFMDGYKTFPTGVLCGACATVTSSQPVLRNFQRCVITKDGVYPIGTDANRSWLWLTPPEPPFVVVINHSTMGAYHYVWRTPVSLSKDLICANLDDSLVWVDRPVFLAAVQACTEIETLMTAMGVKKFNLWKSPSREARGDGHGQLTGAVWQAADKSPEVRQRAEFLSTLSEGVLLALASVVKSKPVVPEVPTLITSFTK